MANEQFNNGDVVVLKSGGPKMTIKVLYPTKEKGIYATCLWFVDGADQTKPSEADFPIITLVKS